MDLVDLGEEARLYNRDVSSFLPGCLKSSHLWALRIPSPHSAIGSQQHQETRHPDVPTWPSDRHHPSFNSSSIWRTPKSTITLSKQRLVETMSLDRSHLFTCGICCSPRLVLGKKGHFRVLQTYAQGGSRERSALVKQGPPFSIPEVSRQDVDTIIAFKELKRFTHILSVVGQKDICVIVRFPEDATPPYPSLPPTQHLHYPPGTPPGPTSTHLGLGITTTLTVTTLPTHGLHPLGIACTDMRFGMAFLLSRLRLFENGPYDHDALAYEAGFLAQLEREYHPVYVETVKVCTKVHSSDGKEVYHRSECKVLELGEIPADKSLMKLMVQLKESGRFGDLLVRASLDGIPR
ncbi:uncharacterized protein ARMOST_08695 [Armillaria ostoyae]|uniref:Uncharacterized protein n=1 Tax=Armillaria ostoyae TaxID=47428 RepID=A0A284R9C1_ARMOS|nr:uncharacterized protein ARMOST_08695 [Armillaria ostoyae]